MSSEAANNIRLHWDCRGGANCFNRKKRLKFSVFYDVLPGKISFTDVDAMVEVGGRFLFMEWKDGADFPVGQRLLFERMTRDRRFRALLVDGDAEHMVVRGFAIVAGGAVGRWWAGDMQNLLAYIRMWSSEAKG